MLSEQDTFAPFLGSQPDAEHEANRPIARDNAAVVVCHEDRMIRPRLIGKSFRDFIVAIEDCSDDAQLEAALVQGRLPSAEDQLYPFVGMNKAGRSHERSDQAV